jgi:hypothetical protein
MDQNFQSRSNGAGNYGFMISVIDEKQTPSTDTDRFHIKIWDIDNGDAVVYDNDSLTIIENEDASASTAIAGGNITVHSK